MWQYKNSRMVWVGRGCKDHLVSTPYHTQGHLPQDQAAQSPVQPGQENQSTIDIPMLFQLLNLFLVKEQGP